MKNPNFTQLLIKIMLEHGIDIKDDSIANSLDIALSLGQFRFITNHDKCIGFYTWELRPTLHGLDIGITNMIIYKGYEGTYCFKRIITFLKSMYPNINAFIWLKRKTGQLKTFKQRKQYALSS